MREGDYLKEKKEQLVEKFQTKQGLVNYFVGTAIWWAIIVNYIDPAYEYFLETFKGIAPHEYIAMYFSYLSLGLVFSIVGYGVSYAIIEAYKKFLGGG